MSKPLVSILSISYNQARYIRDTLDSALQQDYQPIEIVISDDGSTDGTAEVIAEYADRYPDRIKALIGGPRLGITGNCNRALASCTGKYIAFLGGDDIFLPDKVELQVRWMEQDSRRVLCGHDADVFDSASNQTLYFWRNRFGMRSGHGAADIVRYGCPFTATTIMVRTSAIPPYGFDTRLPLASDWKFWIDCLASGGEYGYIAGVYARYRRHIQNVTNISHSDIRQLAVLAADAFSTLALTEAEYPHLLDSCRYGRSVQYYVTGTYYLLKGHGRTARHYFWHALLNNPFVSLKTYAAFMITMLPGRIVSPLIHRFAVQQGIL